MYTISWPKIKKWNKKGFSSIVGAIFMILIIGILASAYFVFTLAQNSSYNDAVKSNSQLTLMQMSESIKVPSAATYNQAGTGVTVSVTLRNDGPIGVQVKTLWIKSSTNNYGFANIDHYLLPGESYPLTNKPVNPQSGQIDNATCYGWVITARGRTFELFPDHGVGPQGIPGPTGITGATGPTGPTGPQGPQGTVSYDANTALVAQGIGSITLDFTNLTAYYLVGPQVNGYNTTMGAGMSGYNIYLGKDQPSASSIYKTGFSVNLTNMNPTGTIYLNSSSVFFSVMPYVKTGSQSVEAAAWYVVNVDQASRVIRQSYARIELPYNVSTRVYFFAKDDVFANSVFSFQYSDGGTLVAPTTTPINLALIGNIVALNGTSRPFGQNLPFVSIYVNG